MRWIVFEIAKIMGAVLTYVAFSVKEPVQIERFEKARISSSTAEGCTLNLLININHFCSTTPGYSYLNFEAKVRKKYVNIEILEKINIGFSKEQLQTEQPPFHESF